jgi:hypothetical protein
MCGGDTVVKGPGMNYSRGKRQVQITTQNSVKNELLKGWRLKGQSHFFQLKNINKRQKQKSCVKICGSLLNRVVKDLVSQTKKQAVNGIIRT